MAPANEVAGPLPEGAYKAEITLPGAPAKLSVGQAETVRVRVRNASPAFWWARGGRVNNRADNMYYIAAGNRWLDSGGKKLTEMDGRIGIGKDLGPGEEVEVPLLVHAPREPGDYILEVDLVQEQVAWFGDKGSPAARVKVAVVK